jgi:dTDP-4-amino-4,6-dideoxy-D-galactose acyltransferase
MEKLDWDSNFWGLNIYQFNGIDKLNVSIQNNEKFLIQALPNVSDIKFIQSLEEHGFNFQESKITFKKEKFQNIDNNSNFRVLSEIDLKPYEENLYELYGRNTRFHIFPKVKVNEFYYTWLVNSTLGNMDDECIGYFIDEELAGFVTYRIKNDLVIIGLLGVFPKYRGFGVSQLLLNFIDNVAINKKLNRIQVSTQGKNTNAINAYIKSGYYISSIDHWYYFIQGGLYDSI